MKKTIFLLICNIFLIAAQKPSGMINRHDLDSKNKADLIKIALKILKEKQPSLQIDLDDFEPSAWQNSKQIIVKFRKYIRFIPLNSALNQYYDITVNLITKQVLPFESGYNFTFYVPTEEDKTKLDFIKSTTDFSKQPTSEITITENEDYYWISNSSKTSLSKFFINKKTGFKSGFLEGTFSLPQVKPVLESPYDREGNIELLEEDELSINAKKEIIDMAVALLTKKQPLLKLDFNEYESNILGDSKNILVEFKRIIRYIPIGLDPEKHLSYDITLNLNTNKILPFDDTFYSEFYIETKEDKEALKFIKKNFGVFSSSFTNTIQEGEKEYFISTDNRHSFGKYVLDKTTGIQGPPIQSSYLPMPQPNSIEDPNVFIEIK